MSQVGEGANASFPEDDDIHWVEVNYTYPDGMPVDVRYIAIDSNGTEYHGYLNDEGGICLNYLPAGSVEVELAPDVDEDEIQSMRDEIKKTLDEILIPQQKKYQEDQARLASMNYFEREWEEDKAFYKGVWNQAVSLVESAPELFNTAVETAEKVIAIKEYLSPTARISSVLESVYESYQSGALTEEDWIDNVTDNIQENEVEDIKQLVAVVGDPEEVAKVFAKAYDIASFIYDDEPTREIILSFAEDYANAISSLDVAEFSGGIVFEIILDALITVATAGAGAAAAVASKVRHVGKMRKLGMIFERLYKKLKLKKLNKKSRLQVDSTRNISADTPNGLGLNQSNSGSSGSSRKNKDAGKNKNGDDAPDNRNTCTNGCPISMVTGEEILEQVDFVLPGSLPLVWRRTYRSTNDENRGLGYGWTISWFSRLEVNQESVIYHDSEGREIPFDKPEIGEKYNNRVEKLIVYRDSQTEYRIVNDNNETLSFSGPKQFKQLRMFYDQHGNVSSLQYDKDDNLEFIIDSTGRQINLIYNASGLLDNVILYDREGKPNKRLITYVYNDDNDLIAVKDAGLNIEKFDYKNHILIKRTTPDGFNLFFTWDDYSKKGKCIRNWGDNGIYDYTFEYDTENKITRSNDGRNNTTEYHYDDLGLITKEKDPEGGVTLNEYDENGKLLITTDPLGNITEFSYAENSKIESITDALGQQTSFEYDDNGNITKQIDAAGQSWLYEFDQFSNLIKSIDPADNTTQYEYNEQGLPVQITNAVGDSQYFNWDKYGQLIAQLDGEQQHTQYQYDLLGRIITIADHDQQLTHYRYDSVGNVLKVKQADGGIIKMTYTPGGRLKSYTDQLNRTTTYEYDGLSQPVFRIDSMGRKFHYEYDKERNLTALINENGERYELEYDKNERLIKEVGFDGRTQIYQYNQAGHLSKYLDGLLRETEFVRDPLGKLLETNCKLFNEEAKTDDIERECCDELSSQFEYDALGRIKQAVNDDSELSFEYDKVGNLISESQNGEIIKHQYDAIGLRNKICLPNEQTIEFEYNKQGLFSQLSIDGNTITSIKRNQQGYETSRSMGEITSEREYDPMGRLIAQRNGNRHKPILSRKYRYDISGNLQQIEDIKQGSTFYNYDPLNRLKQVGGKHTEQFEFDPAGNILDSSIPAQGGLVQGNRLKVFQDYRFKYDDVGNLVQQRKGKSTSNFTYNIQNQLIKVEKDGQIFEYKYDVFGRRISKKDAFGETSYLWNGDALISEARNNLQTTYINEPDSFTPLCQVKNNSLYYYHNDHIGTPQILTDTQGEVVWQARYKVYGNVIAYDIEEIENPLRFQGQYFDKETGLHYNRHRYYHPVIGRFTSVDPIGLVGGDNNYEYAVNPLGWVDPLGLSAEAGDCPVVTQHTQVTGGNKTAGAPNTGSPNSIHEQTRPNGSKSITYYDEKGRMFSREDYGQQRTHGQLGRGSDGLSVPHEHGVDWSDKGPIGKKYRELDATGKPVGPWIKE